MSDESRTLDHLSSLGARQLGYMINQRKCKPTGKEVGLETAELAVLEGKGNRLGPEELGLLAKRLASGSNPDEAARIRELLTCGFYGVGQDLPAPCSGA